MLTPTRLLIGLFLAAGGFSGATFAAHGYQHGGNRGPVGHPYFHGGYPGHAAFGYHHGKGGCGCPPSKSCKLIPDHSLDTLFKFNLTERVTSGNRTDSITVVCVPDRMLIAPAVENPGRAPDFGDPLDGLSREQKKLFAAGREAFEAIEDIDEGLGPIFNGRGCVVCHNQAATGGGSNIFETRFGLLDDSLRFDPLMALGGSLLQVFSIGDTGTPAGCFFPTEMVPDTANVVSLRRSIALFGDGLIDNVPDSVFQDIAGRQQMLFPRTAGRVSTAVNIAQNVPVVSKFGWKAQVPNLFQFSGNAYLNEMGITTPCFPLENCPNMVPNCSLIQVCDPLPGVDDDNEDVQAFTDFMSFLAPPPRGRITREVLKGGRIFVKIGCANCHLPTLRTGPNCKVPALNQKVFHPYSDFLLHDMGSLGDSTSGGQGNADFVLAIATPREMRTQPLWGLRIVERFLHDGRALTIPDAILAHDGQGAMARENFKGLSGREKKLLQAFLMSL